MYFSSVLIYAIKQVHFLYKNEILDSIKIFLKILYMSNQFGIF